MSIQQTVEQDQLLQKAAGQLTLRLQQFTGTRRVNERLVDDMERIVKQHRRDCRSNLGIDFPELVPLALPLRGIVQWVRRDADRKMRFVLLANLATAVPYDDKDPAGDKPRVTEEEIAWAAKRAWGISGLADPLRDRQPIRHRQVIVPV